ncbi:sulfatase-like hydrolase/transferase [Candidatus Poribacteria bacterium]|nr:sulfatase-like hydrolase/transferase [Candidatus Poribacteria bacterium]
MPDKINTLCIVSDTLRTDYLGCYGNKFIKTPNLDAFARDSVVFEWAHPESLPTIPYRRSLHTGRRAYPFKNYKPVRWDNVYLPGWQPMDNMEDSLAENLFNAGYYTGFVSDVPHYFVPGMNFTRGAQQWEFVRGQAEDKWRSPAVAPYGEMSKYGDPEQIKKQFPGGRILRHVANYYHIHSEEETSTAKVFRWAMDFVQDNRNVHPFYLYADCFAPHESWEAPDDYLEMYADPNYKGKNILSTAYAPADGRYTEEEVEYIKAHYCGLVSLVDNWFGTLINKLKRLGLYENSLIVFTSDHGTNFTDNSENVIGKPHYSLFPGVMHIPLIVHFPGGEGAGKRFSDLVYNTDATATIYDYAGVDINELDIHGQSFRKLVFDNEWQEREYLTCRYGDTVWYRDQKNWIIISADGKARCVFDLETDLKCQNNILDNTDESVIKKAWKCILDDAGGEIPIYDMKKMTDAVGRK